MDSVEVSTASIVKLLASCSQPTRSRAVRLLCRWLPQQSSAIDSLSDGGDLIKIWKGLFYCVWHADKLPFQLDLINRLSSLLETLSPNLSILYFESFLVTIRREWSGIDFLRLDKFYLLIRKFTHHFFALLKKNKWNVVLVNRLVGVLREKCLLATDKYQASGVNYHITDIFLEEIDAFWPIKPEILDMLLMPFLLVLERSNDRVLVKKVVGNVFERMVESGEAEKFGKHSLALGFSKKFFKSASDEGTVQGNRKLLFGLHERFLKLEKERAKSGLEISFGDEGEKPVSSNDAEMIDGDGGSEVSLPKKGMKEDVEKTKKKKKKKKKKKLSDPAEDSNGGISDVAVDVRSDDDLLNFDESMVSNLQKQFEKVAAEVGMASPATPVNIAVVKKRKRAKGADKQSVVSNGGKSGEKRIRRVRFSLKDNLIWKPRAPMPPQSLRLPPSVTPRGSALKKGVPPGPIKGSPATVKKIKVKGSSVKMARRSMKRVSPAAERLDKLQSLSV